MGATRNTGYLENLIAYDASDNVAIATTAIDNAFKITMGGSVKMTGALTGTSATFNFFRSINNTGFLLRNDANSTNLGGLTRRSYWAGGTAADTQIFAETGYAIYLNPGGSSSIGLTLASTGAATFSGSVGIGGATVSSYLTGSFAVNASGDNYVSIVSPSVNAAGLMFQDTTGTSIVGGVRYTHSDDTLSLWTNGGSRLSISSTGAATFSSSVTATKGFFSSNGASDSTTGLLANASTNDNTTYAAIFGSLNAGYRMVVRADGNVGIGTTSPDYLFTIDGQTGDASTVTLSRFYASKGQSGAAYLQIQGTRHPTASVRRMILDAYDGGGASVNLILQQSGGNVGIGTVTPNYQLELGGTGPKFSLASTSSTGYDEIYFHRNTTTVIGYIASGVNETVTSNGDAFVIDNRISGGNIVFRTNNAGTVGERMRITSGGAVLVGTTSDNGYSKFQVNGNISLGAGSGNTAILDSGNTYVTLANNATQNFASFSGFIIVNNYSTGAIQLFVVGGGSTASVYLLGGALGTIAYNGSINGYIFTNNTGVTNIYNFTAIRTRVNA